MIKDQEELQNLLKLCRKQGVTEITLEGVSIKFGALPARKSHKEDTDDEEIQTDGVGLTDEQLMLYSVQGPEGM